VAKKEFDNKQREEGGELSISLGHKEWGRGYMQICTCVDKNKPIKIGGRRKCKLTEGGGSGKED
jgi:hypothetical protein